jgi:hypothetical protein
MSGIQIIIVDYEYINTFMVQKKSNSLSNIDDGAHIINNKLKHNSHVKVQNTDIDMNHNHDHDQRNQSPIFVARMLSNGAKSAYLTYDDILLISDMYMNHLHDEKIKDILRVKFINKNIDHLDNMFNRIIELNVNDKDTSMEIVAVYGGDKDAVMRLFQKDSSPEQKDTDPNICISCCRSSHYQPSEFELGLLLARLHHDEYDNQHDDFCTHSVTGCRHSPLQKDRKMLEFPYQCGDQRSEFPCESLLMEPKNMSSNPDQDKDRNKIYVSDIKIAVFRLIIGVAYRSFRPNRSGKKLQSEPYKFIDLINLVKSATNLLRDLCVITETQTQTMTRLGDILQDKYNNIIDQNNNAKETNIEINKGYVYGRLEAELNHNISNMQKINELKKYDISITSTPHINTNYSNDLKSRVNALHRRQISLPYVTFKKRFSSIIVQDHDEFIPNALIENKFWYDDFLPMLLRGLSVDTQVDDQLYRLLDSDKDELDVLLNDWFEDNHDAIDTYCGDIADSFDNIMPNEKIIIKQCWDMTKSYLMDQSNPDSIEANQESDMSGDQIIVDLSQYIPFIDEYVGTRYTMDYNMTPTLPQYIGTPVWKFLHAIPEMMDHHISALEGDNLQNMTEHMTNKMMGLFTDFFVPLLKTYPCPYCRNHIVNFVIKNTEILNYPMEYIFMDWDESQKSTMFNLAIHDKLRSIKTISDLRLFLWKFHNAVNSSMTEENETNQVPASKKIISKNTDSQNNSDTEDMSSCEQYNDNESNDIESNDRDMANKNINKCNENYTDRHWPDPNIFDEPVKQSYNDAVNQLIEHREIFASAIIETHNNKIDKPEKGNLVKTTGIGTINSFDQAINHFNAKIRDIADKIKTDITNLDRTILESGILQNLYKVVDL